MSVLGDRLNRDFPSKDQHRGELLRLLAERLMFLRVINAVQADAFDAAVVHDFDGVYVKEAPLTLRPRLSIFPHRKSDSR